MSRYEVDPLLAVGLEGTFGLLTTGLAMPILHILFAEKYETFDLHRLWAQVNANWMVVVLSFAMFVHVVATIDSNDSGTDELTLFSIAYSMLSISSFNFFGLSVTKTLSATARSTVRISSPLELSCAVTDETSCVEPGRSIHAERSSSGSSLYRSDGNTSSSRPPSSKLSVSPSSSGQRWSSTACFLRRSGVRMRAV